MTEKKSVENDHKDRTVFDTEMIRAATHQKNRMVEFQLITNEKAQGVPITVDRDFILIQTETGREVWIAKAAIVRCLIQKNAER